MMNIGRNTWKATFQFVILMLVCVSSFVVSGYIRLGTTPTHADPLLQYPTRDDILPTWVPTIPQDRVVAVYSDGQIVDFSQNISRYLDNTSVIGDSMFIPPTYPEISENPALLRIIGGDDRFQISDTAVFPWTTVVKIDGQWDTNTFLDAQVGC